MARAAALHDSDFTALKEHLSQFAENGQLSIFSGNWFDAEDGTGFKLPPELDLICTAHYLEALGMQAKASQISALLGGKMPHVMTLRPGGTAFVPTDQKLDDLKALVDELYTWIEATMIPDVLAIAPYYTDALQWGKGPGRYIAWGVFEREDFKMANRYLPSGVLDENLNLTDPDEKAIAEWVGRSWYKGSETYQAPNFTTEPEYTDYDVNDRYTWVKCPSYNGNSMEATSLSRILAAYKRNVPFVKEHVDAFLEALGHPGDLSIAQYQISANPGKYVQLETPLSTEHYAVGFKKGNTELANQVTETLKQLDADGTVKKLCEKYASYGISYDNWVLGK